LEISWIPEQQQDRK